MKKFITWLYEKYCCSHAYKQSKVMYGADVEQTELWEVHIYPYPSYDHGIKKVMVVADDHNHAINLASQSILKKWTQYKWDALKVLEVKRVFENVVIYKGL